VPESIVTRPCCPRCGYDQSGIVASWRETCPLGGTCTECGLELPWRDVLNPMHTLPRWSFEHAHGGFWKKVGCLLKTARAAMRPSRFYTAMRMEHPIMRGRLVISIAALLLAVHVLLAAPQCLIIQHGYGWPWSAGATNELTQLWISSIALPYASLVSGWYIGHLGVHNVVLALLWAALMPLSYLVLWQTLRQVRVRRAHILRVGVYAAVAVPLLAVLSPLVPLSDTLLGTQLQWRGGALWLFRQGRFLVPMMAVWQTLVWHRAARDYLRLPQPWRISLVMAVMSFLASLVIWTIFSDEMQSELTAIVLYLNGVNWY
jgi:hypothetical protein